jgi:hypothetical protein
MVKYMKKMKGMVALGILSIMLLAGANTATACEEGLTIGYWKNHTEDWVDYSTTDTIESVFGDLPEAYDDLESCNLEAALRFKGGKGILAAGRLLLKQAVAAALNIAHPDIDYIIDFATLNERVLFHLTSEDRSQILSYKNWLDDMNNLGLID